MSRDEFKQRWSADLREERVVLNLTQREVAEALHVAESTVSRWESGATPGLFDVKRLKRFLRDRAVAKGMTAERVAAAKKELRERVEAGTLL